MAGIGLITSEGSFDASIRKALNSNFNTLGGAIVAVGNVFFLDPAAGNDGNSGLSSTSAFQTLAAAYAQCSAGHNDTVVLIANGGTTATARIDASFTWAKNETHLMGYCAPTLLSQRARLAPTGTTTAFTPFFTVSGSGCIFQNIQWFHGFNTGTTAQINMVITGSRNYFVNCHIVGMGDTTSATDAGSRSLVIGLAGSGENAFLDCTFGDDTNARSGANATVEFKAATVRNIFRKCIFPINASASSPFFILGTGADCVDRFQEFDNCTFVNGLKSGATGLTAAASFTNAAPGGLILFKDCALIGATKWGDTNMLANSYLNMPVVSAAAGGLMLNPS